MEKYLTVKELSDLIQISPRTLYEWTHIGFIPHYKLPRGVRFKIAEVEKWMEGRRRRGRNSYKLNIDHFD